MNDKEYDDLKYLIEKYVLDNLLLPFKVNEEELTSRRINTIYRNINKSGLFFIYGAPSWIDGSDIYMFDMEKLSRIVKIEKILKVRKWDNVFRRLKKFMRSMDDGIIYVGTEDYIGH